MMNVPVKYKNMSTTKFRLCVKERIFVIHRDRISQAYSQNVLYLDTVYMKYRSEREILALVEALFDSVTNYRSI